MDYTSSIKEDYSRCMMDFTEEYYSIYSIINCLILIIRECFYCVLIICGSLLMDLATPICLLLVFLGFLYVLHVVMKPWKADLKCSLQDKFHGCFKVLAACLSLCGFLALLFLSSKPGLALILVASAINTSTNVSDLVAIFKGINYHSTSLKKFNGHLGFADPIIHLLGSVLILIALLSISNDKMPMVWFGLIGSILTYIGGLLNVRKVSRQ